MLPNILIPIIAVISQATSLTLDKALLSFRNVGFRNYIGTSFPLIFIFVLIIFLIMGVPFSWALLYKDFWWIMLFCAIAIVANILFYRALDSDYLTEIQTIELLRNIPIVIVSGLIFTDERNLSLIIPTIIASMAIIWSHWKNHRIEIEKKTIPFFLWSLISAPTLASISKMLLVNWDPVSLELVRSGVMALVLGPMFIKYVHKTSPRALWLFIITNMLTAVAFILFYTSYKDFGIIYTILLFTLEPFLVYFASVLFLKEPVHLKKMMAFLVVLIAIAVTQIL